MNEQKEVVDSNRDTGPHTSSNKIPVDEAQSGQELDKLKREVLELREKLLQLRETDIFSLREKLTALSSQLKTGVTIAGIVGVVFTGFGIKQYRDLNELINTTMNKKIEESLGYYEQLGRALMLSNNGACSSAIPIFRELSDKHPDDELVFLNVMNCFIEREEYEQGYQFITNLRTKVTFPGKFKLLLSYNNAGFVVLVNSLRNSSFEGEALELLQRSEEIGREQNDQNIVYPLFNLTVFYTAKGDESKAASYASRLKALKADEGPQWSSQVGKQWFKLFAATRPKAQTLLQKLLPVKKGNVTTQSTNSK